MAFMSTGHLAYETRWSGELKGSQTDKSGLDRASVLVQVSQKSTEDVLRSVGRMCKL